jgi:Tol biopolymer transport system component
MQADGSNRELIPNYYANYYDAGYSLPDFTRNGSGMVFVQNGDLFIMNMDGSNKTKVTNHGSGCSDPKWSPDASHIVFLLNLQPYVINADGSNEHAVAVGISAMKFYAELTWSPDGSKIAFVTPWGSTGNGGLYSDICVANSNGSGYVIVSPHNGSYDSPSWSPDGSIIVFGSGNHIYSVFPDGSNLKTITTSIPVTGMRGLALSPDGSLVSCIGTDDGPTGNYDNIFVFNLSGSYEKEITLDRGVTTKNGMASGYFRADWSPDGKKIIGLLGHNEDGSTDVNLMDPDGSNLTKLCNVICDYIFIIKY